MAELEEMKNLVAMLKAENEKMGKSGGSASSNSGDTSQMDKLSELLAQKQRELEGRIYSF
jgi:hypothetical protein